MELTKEKLLENNGELAHKLAMEADQAFADSEFAQDYEILSAGHPGSDGIVAYYLASHSGKTGWKPKLKKVLSLFNGEVKRLLNGIN